jgi:hypothetical protein
MLLFSPRWLFFYPGLALMLGGAALGLRLLAGPWAIVAGVRLDVHTLLFCAVAVLLGFLSVAFAVLTKVFAQRAGLRPVDRGFDFWLRWATLEAGLVAGAALALAGLALSGWAVWFWKRHHFGDLEPTQVLRWVISGATLLMLGCQMVLVSFFLSVLRLDVRAGDPRGETSA